MRLLKTDYRNELSLIEYPSGHIPRYAILSHTWGVQDDEVTFNDVQNGTGMSKAGYAKIRFCCEQARKDGLEYIWVHTCCIDKANQVELSEAINSMFRWYRNASKCYVYLSDVSVREEDNKPTKWMWESAFRQSRWFTRCWTLQDLLAPISVDFFSREGEFLGNKRTLELPIHEITQIPIAALRGAPLSHFSVEERLRWTENRQAMRLEDKAYSLLGIFGVFMPLLYGEGDHAFIRLRREIQATENDDELVSVRSVDTLHSTATGSSATLVGEEILAAANEFVILLLEDQALAPLLSTAFERIETDRLERNIRRLLKLYALDLQQEATDNNEKEAAQLILMRARYIARCVRQNYDRSASEKADAFERLIEINSGKRALLENYLSDRTRQSTGISISDPHVDDCSDGDVSDANTVDEAGSDHLVLGNLDRVKVFMFESAAYHKFRLNLRDFVSPPKKLELQDSLNTTIASFSAFDTLHRLRAKSVEALNGLRMLSRPLVPPGYKRISWICGCGDHRYADVREYRPNGAFILQQNLRRSAVATNEDGNNGGASQLPHPPTQAYFSTNSAAKGNSLNLRSSSNTHATRSIPPNITSDTSILDSSSEQSDHIFLLLCLTISGSSFLEQISIRDLGNDQYLWHRIREHYHEIRSKTLWHQKLTMTRWLVATRWLSWLVKILDLTSAHSIQFVRFQLVPIAMDIRPWNFSSPSLPPEVEVRVNKTYLYEPCPADVDPTGLSGELLHCLWKPGPHLDRFWLNLFPKKLKEALHYMSSKQEDNKGWGIHIVEGLNWASVTFLGLILVGISAVLGIVYSAVTHDVGAAFSISAFLGVLPALGIASLQLRPIELVSRRNES